MDVWMGIAVLVGEKLGDRVTKMRSRSLESKPSENRL